MPDIKKLGIIAGGGSLPAKLLHACDEMGIEVFVIGFDGQTDPALTKGRHYMWTRLGAAGQILNTLKSHDIHDLVLIGSIRRPSLMELRPDFKATEFFARIGLKALGDNDLLVVLRGLLEEEGFQIHGAHRFAQDLLAPGGHVGKYKPKKDDWIDIKRGMSVALNLGGLDIGQAVIVQEGIVLGVEAAEGTDELIRRCKHLKRKGRGGVLVKLCKPEQDEDFDLPTIGPVTLKHAVETGLNGVVVHAGRSLMLEPQSVAEIADRYKMFVIGVHPDELL